MHLFDGSTMQSQLFAWDESMPRQGFNLTLSINQIPLTKITFSCMSQSKNIRTYAAVLWEAPYHYDKSKFFILNSIINLIKILFIKKLYF